MAKVLVVGCAGYVGREVCRQLEERGDWRKDYQLD
jgi:nucleoside-diphosphate-sugar epimerase